MESVSVKDISMEVTSMEPQKEKSVFDTLNAINVNDHKENKNGLSYLSWVWAWGELQKRYPDASYTIKKFGDMEKPYMHDENTGYMVFTSVTVNGETREMWLPVMDNANKAMKNKPYEYTAMVWSNEQYKKVPVTKTVQAATMFDINKAIMRCLVKNIGMFGLGLYVYAGEDIPESDFDNQQEPQVSEREKKEKPQQKSTGKLLMEFKECQRKLGELKIDIHSEKIKQWMADHTGYADQSASIDDVDKTKKLIAAYNTLIKGKEEQNG